MMAKPRVFVSRIIPDAGLEKIHEIADAEVWQDELPPPYETLLEKVRGVDGLVCLLTDRIDGGLMDAAGDQLKVISQMAVGYDNVSVPDATARGIPVGNTPGVLTDTTADFAFTLMVAAARRIVEGERYVKAGRWKTWGPTLLMGHDIFGATLGIVGFGRIGQGMARRASGFNMRVLAYDPTADEATAQALGVELRPLDDVLAESDFVSLHVPLTEETYHLVGERELKLMKPSSVLINSARGPVIDPRALYQALKHGEIACVALDVTEPEPIQADDPLLTLDNCLIVPHIASSSLATRGKMATMAAANLEAGLKGERLPNCVNPEVYG
jgi:glyoxylate reductase